MRAVPYEEFTSQQFKDAWNLLLNTQPIYDIGNTYEWTRRWWDTYKDIGVWKKELFIIAQENNGQITAIFPLLIKERL